MFQLQHAIRLENQMLENTLKNMAHQLINSGRANQVNAATNQEAAGKIKRSIEPTTQTTSTTNSFARNHDFMGGIEAALECLTQVLEDP